MSQEDKSQPSDAPVEPIAAPTPLFPISGQLIFREAGRAKDGRRLMSCVGIIAFPEDLEYANEDQELLGEHQYTVAAKDDACFQLTLHLESRQDVSDVSIGNDLGYLLREPIWRC